MIEPVTITSLDVAADAGVADFYRVVLQDHFRPDELVSPGDLSGGLRDGTTMALVARAPGGAIVGGIVCDWFARSQVLLLSYIAVPEAYRGHGIASRLLAALRAACTALAPRLIVAEVEDPRYYADTTYGDPVARVRLYERDGDRTLPIPYAQPALGPAGSRVPHLLLMVFGGRDAPPNTERVDGALVAGFLAEYYESCEGPPRAGDAEYEAMLAACQRPGGLPLLLVADLPPDLAAVD